MNALNFLLYFLTEMSNNLQSERDVISSRLLQNAKSCSILRLMHLYDEIERTFADGNLEY